MKNVLASIADHDEDTGALGRHSLMLFSLIVLLGGLPLGQVLMGGGSTRFSLLLALVLMSAVVVNRHRRWIFVVSSIMGISSVGGIAYAAYFESPTVQIGAEILGLSLLSATTLLMLNTLFQSAQVSLDTVIGGICVYFLIGLCFAMVFILMTDLYPGAVVEGTEALVRSSANSSDHATTLLYFSFVTLTTLGYGDVAPVGEIARMFAVAEAMIGQLYLAIFVARLVALYIVTIRFGSK